MGTLLCYQMEMFSSMNNVTYMHVSLVKEFSESDNQPRGFHQTV